MIYILIRELAGIAQDVIIAISSLTKDINLQQDDLRAQAIRTLCKIIDVSCFWIAQKNNYLSKTELYDPRYRKVHKTGNSGYQSHCCSSISSICVPTLSSESGSHQQMVRRNPGGAGQEE